MNTVTTKLNPFHLAINSLDAFGFRRFPTFSHVDKIIHADKKGWDAYVYFKNGDSVLVSCRGYNVTIDDVPFTHGDINTEIVKSVKHPTGYHNRRPYFYDGEKAWSYSDDELTSLGYTFPPNFDSYYDKFK